MDNMLQLIMNHYIMLLQVAFKLVIKQLLLIIIKCKTQISYLGSY